MTSTVSASAEARLESLLKPYRDLSNAHMESIWTEFAAEHPEGSFPSTKTMRQNSRLFLAGKRYRFALALAGYRLLTGERPSQDLERAATWLEWYHLYTLFLDDIMDEDFRRRKFPSAWSSNARLYRGADGARPATVFRTRRHRYGVSQAILDALRIRSLAEWAIERAVGLHPSVRLELLAELTTVDLILSDGQGLDIDFERVADIPEDAYVRMTEAKTARLYVLARGRLHGADRTAFLRAYGRGTKTTKRDVAVVRDLLRTHVLPAMEDRIREYQKAARDALRRLPARDPEAKQFLESLIEVQGSREA